MRAIEKRQRLIEYLNYLTHHENKSLYPINETINSFKIKTDINIPQSTAYRIIKKYINKQREMLNTQVCDKFIQIFTT